MKKIIRLSESELVSLVKRSIMENEIDSLKKVGCENINDDELRDWCFCAKNTIKEKKNKEYIIWTTNRSLEFFNDMNDIQSRLKKFSKEDDFFKDRIERMKDALLKLEPSCNKARKSFQDKWNDLKKSIVLVLKKENKDEYDILNKLNTNYNALSYLLTLYKKENYENFRGWSTQNIFDKFFKLSENSKDVSTPYERMLGNLIRADVNSDETLSQIYKIIQNTTSAGKSTETKIFNFLKKDKKFSGVVDYTGDYSIPDMMGIDFLVELQGEWIPVQVKSVSGDIYGNSKFCKNMTVYIKNNEPFYDYFNGSYRISKEKFFSK
jgi:hypothetical protein